MNNEETITIIKEEIAEYEVATKFWLERSMIKKKGVTAKERKEAFIAYNKYVTRVVTLQSLLKKIQS